MSHPDPLYDPSDYLLAEYLYDNQEDIYMDNDTNYDDYNDFHDEDDRKNHFDDFEDDSPEFDDFADEDDHDDSMDGDHESALGSAGWGENEYYGDYGDDGDW